MSVFALLIAGAACRKPDQSAAGTLKVALLTPGSISDQSWNWGAFQALTAVHDTLKAVVSHIQTKTPSEFEENFRQYGAQGYRIVFGHGFEFQDAAKLVGPEYPKTVYIVSSSGVAQPPNVAGVDFAFSDASYLAGMLAGAVSKSHIVGTIGGTENPAVKESFDAFVEGVHAISPTARVLRSYIGNWDDVSAGKEHGIAQINQGADVIFQNADAAGLGVFQAARESKGTLIIGSNANQNFVAPEVTLGSVVIDLPRAFLMIARSVLDSSFKAQPIVLGTDTRVVRLITNPALSGRVPADVARRVDSLQNEMFAGRFKAPKPAAISH